MTTWGKELEKQGITRALLVAVAPHAEVLDIEFDDGSGSSQGPEFLAWTETHVWFPVVYDGIEWIGSAPRNPTATGQRHVGGQ